MKTSSKPYEIGNQRVLPQAIEAEERLLSAALLGAAEEIMGLLNPEDFYRTAHQTIFQAISDLHKDRCPVDLNTVVDRLRTTGRIEEVGGAAYVAGLVESIPTAGCVKWFSGRVGEAAARRMVIQKANELAQAAYDEPDFSLLQDHTRQAFQELNKPNAKGPIFTSYGELADTEPERWEKIGQTATGVPSGFTKVDRMTGGFQPSDLIVVAARPGMGKTALMLCIAENAARQGHPVAVFSLEMSKSQLYGRQTARVARIDSQKFRVGGIRPDEWRRVAQAQEDLHGLPVFIDDTPRQHIAEIERRARWATDHLGVKLIVIDYLQLIRGDRRQQRKDLEIADITGSLKGLAKELNIPVILLSQLNRQVENRDNKRPRLSDLRESGAIEQDADIVVFLFQDQYYTKENCKCPGRAELDFSKHRNGPTGVVFLRWIDWRQSFEDYEIT